MSRRLWLPHVACGHELILSRLALIDRAWWQALIIELRVECAGSSDGAGKAAPSQARGHVSRRQQQRQSERLVLALLRCYTVEARVRNLVFLKALLSCYFQCTGSRGNAARLKNAYLQKLRMVTKGYERLLVVTRTSRGIRNSQPAQWAWPSLPLLGDANRGDTDWATPLAYLACVGSSVGP